MTSRQMAEENNKVIEINSLSKEVQKKKHFDVQSLLAYAHDTIMVDEKISTNPEIASQSKRSWQKSSLYAFAQSNNQSTTKGLKIICEQKENQENFVSLSQWKADSPSTKLEIKKGPK